MSRFSAAFQTVASDSRGEALRAKLYVRLNDGVGGIPGTLVEITATQDIISVGDIVQKRERQWGVVQGQAWQVRVTNADLGLLDYSLPGCWAALKCGFEDADEWDLFAQGKISRAIPSGDGTLTLEVYDGVMDLLQFSLPRDITFQDSNWASGIQVVETASGSGSYDEATALTVASAPVETTDETFYIEFTSTTAFKIILEDGDETQTGNTSSDCSVDNVDADTVVTIPSAGWTGTFAAGDRFVFYTARPRTAAELSPVGMIAHLIDDVAGLTVYDVLTGANYSSPRYDTSNWSTQSTEYDDCEIGGLWERGSSLAEMIQDALKIVHGAVFPTHTGQIGLWVMQPSTTVSVELNGDPNRGTIDITDTPILEHSLADAVNEVTFEYLSLEGVAASVTKVDGDTPYSDTRAATVSIGWRVESSYVETSCSRYLSRFRLGRQEYTLPTTLKGVLAEAGTAAAITEPMLGVISKNVDVIHLGVRPLDNAVVIKAYVDYAVNDGYFILGDATTDPVGSQLGSSGMTGAKPMW